ncbi:putative ribonuclease III post-transcriptional gene silencing PAZ-Argonaute family [Helianthus annuus]|uniref:Putative endoribonuclease Dicer n=1 Tax=Helianthus annuus TaxID=4232 RepID=A0A251UM54_HELAN|nr:endoribonuclease Dicer homolog 3 [Helianthus annuus]KAF5804663.1 putative ribonuclease III post-transcriptional gene silencing PAZ-Argonaute family [Helianthus annuus]KAJ0569242.1 putative ribonuclease III [Helianthus annuus]KAJ0575681.1 hypothetical protein HanIR_Chr05g0215551 [Helianthus annuus]KAJ0583550.1 hypothetical protein HanHA89_Chr05g0177921 [Helianthus annuus]
MRSSAGSGYPNKHLKRCFETMMNDHSQPTMHGLDYEKSKVDHEDLKLKLKSSKLQFEVELLEMQISLQRDYKDTDEKHGILRKRLSDDHSKIVYCIDELGLLCAYEAVKICIVDASKAIEECGFFKDSCSNCLHFLEESLSIIENALPNGHETIFYPGCEFEKMVAAGYISPKLYQLVKLLRSLGGATQVLCIILVERIITAKVLDMILKGVGELFHFKASLLTSNTTSVDGTTAKLEKETLDCFRSRKVNLLFATGVVEEEIDLPNCSTVICFDIPKMVHDNVQQWRRVCQSGCPCVMMIERGNEKEREHVCDIIRSEHSMNNNARKREHDPRVVKACNVEETESYRVEATGDSVTADSSISLIRRDCPADNSSSVSKQLLCLETSKILHQMGSLTYDVPPNNEAPPKKKSSENTKESPPPGAGTTKRKELHGTTPIRAVSGTWGDKLDDGIDFYSYRISFKCSDVDVAFSSFVLLLESKLDDDVANLEMELYLVSKVVNCNVSSCGKLHLNAEQIAKGKCFHELFFNGIFAKLYVGSRHSSEPRKFLLETDVQLWNSSYMYFLLPLESLDPFKISWKEIDSCASAIEFIKKSSFSKAEKPSVDSIMTDSRSTNIIHFANRFVHKDDVTKMVVLAIHTGKIYSVHELLPDITAHSPFDGDTTIYSSFEDYFKKKYEIDLVYPGQNMLRLKQSHKAHNLLVDFNGEGVLHGKKIKNDSCKVNTDKQRYFASLPPELLVIIDARIDVVKSLYLLPSLMHRLESLMLASQLREEITSRVTNIHISISLILEAITTLRCHESFSMERLELLGDSVLKYAVSCDLYLRYPKKDEGQLSSRRSWQVCNSTLYNLGIGCRLQSYIRDIPFDPTRWTAPGQLPMRPCPCDHDVETIEVPIDAKYHTEDPKAFLGKSCDMGHRWLGSKTISDCVEALVGAYFVGGGLTGALHCIKWLGISCELDPSHVIEAIINASLHVYTPKLDVLRGLESKLGYEFAVKGLLLEAITHASSQDQGGGYSYQRLEFLGDSVLDLLITRYLFKKHSDIDPGELTDLRSASVNNENFAYAAVRRNLHAYLQYCSGTLQTQISNYVNFVATSSTDTNSLQTKKSPKALGDLFESIAGAILLDTKLDLDEVWRIFELLLPPIVTPEKLELPPYRELREFCDSKGYFVKDRYRSNGDAVIAELRLQLEDALLIAEGSANTRKVARGQAALKMLSQLEKRGISRKNPGHNEKNIKVAASTSSATECLMDEESTSKTEIPILKSLNTKKGAPRASLFEVCQKMQWPMPVFTSSEQKSKFPIEIGEGANRRTTLTIFESRISLTIPNYAVIELMGEPRADKKSSLDSAATLMLYELQKHGKLKIE